MTCCFDSGHFKCRNHTISPVFEGHVFPSKELEPCKNIIEKPRLYRTHKLITYDNIKILYSSEQVIMFGTELMIYCNVEHIIYISQMEDMNTSID